MSLTTWFRDWDSRFQRLLGPWINALPTWANEGLGGLFFMAPVLLLLLLRHHWWGIVLTAVWALGFLVVSQWYEKGPDPNGYDPEDALWRAYGAAVMLVVALVRVLVWP